VAIDTNLGQIIEIERGQIFFPGFQGIGFSFRSEDEPSELLREGARFGLGRGTEEQKKDDETGLKGFHVASLQGAGREGLVLAAEGPNRSK
jgi:hypothetical protein